MHQGSPYRRGPFRLDTFRQRFRERLVSRFGLRLHMTLLLAVVFATAFVAARGLLALGVTSMGARYALACLAGYASFFGLVRAWLWYVTAEAASELEPEHPPDDVARAVEPDVPNPERRGRADLGSLDAPNVPVDLGSGGGGSGGGGWGGLDLDEGVVALLVIAVVILVVVVLFGAAGYLIYQAPAVLGEAALEAVLAAVLARSSRAVTRFGWTGSVLAATWKPALATFVVATLGGLTTQALCPGPSTLRGVIQQCVLDKEAP